MMAKLQIRMIITILILALLVSKGDALGDPIPLSSQTNNGRIGGMNGMRNVGGTGLTATENDLNTCEDQLSKYRRFLLQAIINFEYVCDAYNQQRPPVSSGSSPYSGMLMPDSIYRGLPLRDQDYGATATRNYEQAEPRSEVWTFFKLLMAQFDDIEFTNIIRNAIIERCRIKSQQQRDEKRNSVVLGKKQRFHSWGGKRSQGPTMDGGNGLEGEFI